MLNRSMSRSERLARIEQMLFHNSRGMRVVKIADLCGVDRRTIYRDLVALEKAGVPLRQEDGRYGIIHEKYLTTLRVNFHEVMTLFLAARLMARSAPQYSEHLSSVLNKLGAVLTEPLTSHVNLIAEKVEVASTDSHLMAVLEAITLAWLQRRKVRLWYALPPTEESSQCDLSLYFVDPTEQGKIYVVGYDNAFGEVRVLDLEHVKRASLLDGPSEAVGEYDPDRYLAVIHGASENAVRV